MNLSRAPSIILPNLMPRRSQTRATLSMEPPVNSALE